MKKPTAFRQACLLLACLAGVGARAEDAPTVTPYRPSVSTPAALSAPGWVEVEAGWQHNRGDDPQRRDALPYTLKLAFTPDWGVRIGGEAWVREAGADGASLGGQGDTSIVLKRRFAVDDDSAFGLELGVKTPTARRGLGSGHADTGLNGIYSADFGEGWHTDLNLTATRLGGTGAGVGRWQQGLAAALSHALDDHWGLTGEFSGTRQHGVASTAQALVAASYSLTPGVTLDAGASKGLTHASGDWAVFTGLTFLGFKLF